jgi:hypothetical protein
VSDTATIIEAPTLSSGFRCETSDNWLPHVEADLPTWDELRAVTKLLDDIQEYWTQRILESVARAVLAEQDRKDGETPVTFADVGRLTAWVRDMRVVLGSVTEDVDKVEYATLNDLVDVATCGEIISKPTFSKYGFLLDPETGETIVRGGTDA